MVASCFSRGGKRNGDTRLLAKCPHYGYLQKPFNFFGLVLRHYHRTGRNDSTQMPSQPPFHFPLRMDINRFAE